MNDGAGIFRVDPDMEKLLATSSVEELKQLVEVYQEPGCDDDIELFICICSLITLRTNGMTPEYLERGALMAEGWVAETPRTHPGFDHRNEILMGMTMLMQTKRESDEEWDRKVRDWEEADRLHDQARELRARYERTRAEADLKQALAVMIESTQLAVARHPNFAAIVIDLTSICNLYFERTGDAKWLDFSIDMETMALNVIPHDSPNWAAVLNSLGKGHAERFERLGKDDDIEKAVNYTQSALDAKPRHFQWHLMLANLGTWLSIRFKRYGKMEDINRAVESLQEALLSLPVGDPYRPQALANLASCLSQRFECTDNMDEIDRAIRYAEEAVGTMDPREPKLPLWKSNLAGLLCTRYDRNGSLADLNKAIDIMENNPLPENAAAHYQGDDMMKNNLGTLLSKRFMHTGGDGDLSSAIEMAEATLRKIPRDSPDLANRYQNLANWLGTRYKRQGDRKDLDRAIEYAGKAVELLPLGHSERAAFMMGLGAWLQVRYENAGATEDLSHAIRVLEEAEKTMAVEHRKTIRGANIMVSLANALGSRFERGKVKEDIDRCVELVQRAVDITPKESLDKGKWLSNLAKWAGQRYDDYGDPEDDKRAVDAAYGAVKATPRGSLERGFMLNIFAVRIGNPGNLKAIDNAITLYHMAIKDSPPGHPDRVNWWHNLGSMYEARFQHSHDGNDLKASLGYFLRGWECTNARPTMRIKLGKKAAEALASEGQWGHASEILSQAIDLLPLVSPRSLDNQDKQHLLGEYSGLASLAAAVALNAGRTNFEALRLLELARGVIASNLLEIRTDISKLQERHPQIAKKFTSLRDKLDSSSFATGAQTQEQDNWKSQMNERDKVEREFEAVVKQIRTKPGFSSFLLPPSEEDMKKVGRQGPVVVVNVSPYRCDAFLLQDGKDIKTIRLPVSLEEVQEKAKNVRSTASSLTDCLEWLWHRVTAPVLAELGINAATSDDNLPHIWWIPTGPLNNFPFHAAGIHSQGSSNTVIDRVISSYGSSVKALLYGRSRPRLAPNGTTSKALLVAMEETPSDSDIAPPSLPYATDEVAMLRELCPSLKVHPVEPPRTKSEILSQLPSCTIFHFAGHGLSDPKEPSNSCLLLEDWKDAGKLTVAHFRDSHSLQAPFLAYLSACLTGANDMENLVDEGIHLVGACQLAGFRHVIGALWEVSDRHCVEVAQSVYETLAREGMNDKAVRRGLHFAMKGLRDKLTESMTRSRGTVEGLEEPGAEEESTSGSETDSESMSCAGTEALVEVTSESESRTTRNIKSKGTKKRPVVISNPLIWAPYIHFGV